MVLVLNLPTLPPLAVQTINPPEPSAGVTGVTTTSQYEVLAGTAMKPASVGTVEAGTPELTANSNPDLPGVISPSAEVACDLII
jgi:hypothetical protein